MKTSLRLLLLAVFAVLFVGTASAHYNPQLGRWLSRDPMGEAGGFNLYAYCGNDPVNRHDPLGLQDWGAFRGFSGMLGGSPEQLAGTAQMISGAISNGYTYDEATRGTSPGDVSFREFSRKYGEGYWTSMMLLAPFALPQTAAEVGLVTVLTDASIAGGFSGMHKLGLNVINREAVMGGVPEATIGGFLIGGTASGLFGTAQLSGPAYAELKSIWPMIDWRPVFAPYRSHAFIGLPLPGLPKLNVPSPEVFKMSLPTIPTPARSPNDFYEIANTGTVNYLLEGGGVVFRADGIAGSTILEAKFVTNLPRSPFIANSACPLEIRNFVHSDVDWEFCRMARIIADPSNPLKNVEIIVNEPAANQYFIDLLKKYNLNGRVINR